MRPTRLMTPLALGCSLLAAPLAAGSALGATAADEADRTAASPMEGQCGHFWTVVDTDNDLQVSAEEAKQAAQRSLESMDVDDSGDLVWEEYAECAERATAAMQGAAEGRDRSAGAFARYDADKDGTVSVHEMLAAAETSFEKADRDKSGQLSEAEADSLTSDPMPYKQTPDMDGDGRLSADEMAAAVHRQFLAIDADRSGFIAQSEWQAERREAAREMLLQAAQTQFRLADVNDDGVLSAPELSALFLEEMGDVSGGSDDLGSIWYYRVYRLN